MRGLVLMAMMLSVYPRGAEAQSIEGRVADAVSGAPMGAGFVVLLAHDGTEIARTLTGHDGRFLLAAPAVDQGPYRLRSERIGYQPVTSDPLDSSAHEQRDFILRIRPLPRTLSAIDVRESTQCTVRPAEGAATAPVWEEVRKALSAASWTASRPTYQVESHLYERDLDTRGRQIGMPRYRKRAGYTTGPFVSEDPAQLQRDGYVVFDDDSATYYAPDAHVLQHPTFLDSHCFRVLSDEAKSGAIGLAFEPVPGRVLPDVEGVFWIDRETFLLESIEYRYTGLPREWRTDRAGGGTVEFTALPSGAWIVSRWQITMPTGWKSERVDRFDRFDRTKVAAISHVGGEVLTLRDSAGTPIYEAELAELDGTVVDARAGDPVALSGAVVSLPGTGLADTTDDRGRFSLRAPIAGEHPITFSHRTVKWMDYLPPVHTVSWTRGTRDTVQLFVPNAGEVQRAVCPDGPGGPRSHVLVGTVRNSGTDRPVERVQVSANWQHIAANLDFRNLEARSITNANGAYYLCGLEAERPALVGAIGVNSRSEMLRVSFSSHGVEVGQEVYEVPEPAIWHLDLTLRPRSLLTASVAGIVTDAVSGLGVSEASVHIGESTLVRADLHGAFESTALEPGAYEVTVRRPGYRTRRGEITLEAGEPLVVGADVLALQPMPQVIGAVTDADGQGPVANAQVRLLTEAGTPAALARSDSTGAFTVTAPREGSYLVEAVGIGYARARKGPFTLAPGRPVDVDLSLSPGTVELDPISVSAESADRYLGVVGFYDRQRANRGYFMDRADIEKRDGAANDVTGLISHLPGVIVRDGIPGSFGAPVHVNRACSASPVVFVDGFQIESGPIGGDAAQPSYISLGQSVHPEDVLAIEVYRTPSQIPPQYNVGGSACGVVLIWTIRGTAHQ